MGYNMDVCIDDKWFGMETVDKKIENTNEARVIYL